MLGVKHAWNQSSASWCRSSGAWGWMGQLGSLLEAPPPSPPKLGPVFCLFISAEAPCPVQGSSRTGGWRTALSLPRSSPVGDPTVAVACFQLETSGSELWANEVLGESSLLCQPGHPGPYRDLVPYAMAVVAVGSGSSVFWDLWP